LTSLASSDLQSSSSNELIASYPLRLLEAETCFNATSAGLAKALKCFPHLTYLNLSRTAPARHPLVLSTLQYLPALQVLKLRGIGLRNEDVRVVAKAVGLRIRSLDLRDNRLTDESVRFILQECVLTPGRAKAILYQNVSRLGGLTPGMHMYFGHDLPTVFKTDYQDALIRHRLTSEFFHHLGMEVASGTGLTHLYISGNDLSVTPVADMLRLERFHVLDVGTIHADSRSASPTGHSYNTSAPLVRVENLTPLLDLHGTELSCLRVSHEIVTKLASPRRAPIAELDSGFDGLAPCTRVDMYDTPALFELEADMRQPQELPGENSFVFELEGSPVIPDMPNDDGSATKQSKRRDTSQTLRVSTGRSAPNSPERATCQSSSPLLSPLAITSPRSASPTDSTHTPIQTLPLRGRSYSGVLEDHEARINYRKSQPHSLLPSMVPRLRSLVLTDVPTHWPSHEISKQIIAFIRACAEEAHWSRLRARHSYALPPGRDRVASELMYAKSLFQLKRLVLEMKPTMTGYNGHSIVAQRNSVLSSVEDADCDTFWQAASGDFSFFGNDAEEECGVREREMRQSMIPMEVRMGKMVVDDDTEAAYGSPNILSGFNRGASPIPMFDVLAEVSKFRKEKRTTYQAALRRGEMEPYIEGYWDGGIVIMRPDRK